MSNPQVVALVDFDGTAAEQNVAETLLHRFGGEAWKGYREAFRKGEMTLREYQERAFNGVEASLEEMGEALKGLCWPRAGFDAFVSYCYTNGIQLIIVTNGLEFYVDSVLKNAGLRDVPSCSVGVQGPPGRLQYSYPFETEACWEWGNCKCRILDEHRNGGGVRTVFIGDGYSDYCAGRHADAVFARAAMLERCREEGLPHREFDDFHDVLAAFRAGIPGVWEPEQAAERRPS